MTDKLNLELSAPSEQLVSEFATHAIYNYHNLHCAAEELYARGYFGYSRSIAIAAQEEFGKMVGSLGYLAGIVPASLFRKGIRSHIRKLIWARAILDLAGHLPELMPNTAAATLASDDLENMKQGIAEDLPSLEQRFMTSAKLLSEIAALAPIITAIDRAEYEKLRQAGLYVNLEPTSNGYRIGHPGFVDAQMATEQLAILRKFKKLIADFAGADLIEGPQVGWFDESTVKMLSNLLLGMAQTMRALGTQNL